MANAQPAAPGTGHSIWARLTLGGAPVPGAHVTADAHHAKRHTSFAATWVRLVTRLPWLTAVLVIAGLATMAVPARDLALALPNNGTSGPQTTQRQAFDTIATDSYTHLRAHETDLDHVCRLLLEKKNDS